jgi:hypothetical protein
MGWYFLWGPFRGGIFFGVRSEGIFLCLRIMFGGAGPAESMAGETLNNAIKDEIVWWGTLHFEISTRATPGISASS